MGANFNLDYVCAAPKIDDLQTLSNFIHCFQQWIEKLHQKQRSRVKSNTHEFQEWCCLLFIDTGWWIFSLWLWYFWCKWMNSRWFRAIMWKSNERKCFHCFTLKHTIYGTQYTKFCKSKTVLCVCDCGSRKCHYCYNISRIYFVIFKHQWFECKIYVLWANVWSVFIPFKANQPIIYLWR